MTRKSLFLILLTILLAVALGAAGDRHDVFSVPTVEPEASGAQPVDVMNWLVDENGNLKVSNQVRTETLRLLDHPESVSGTWISAEFDVRGYSSLILVAVQDPGGTVTCQPRYRWTELGPDYILPSFYEWRNSGSGNTPSVYSSFDDPAVANRLNSIRYPIDGEMAQIECTGNNATLKSVHVLLRAE